MKKALIIICLFFVFSLTGHAQLTPFHHWTLLPESQMDEIIGEASGETALHHVIEMVGYQRNRPASEYQGTFREAQYVVDKLREYGIDNATIERFEGGETWDGIRGELWEVSPNRTKLADYDDIALMLASGSVNTDVTAGLIWVEEGLEKDFTGLDVKGKIVVTSGSIGQVHRLAVSLGAVGVVGIGSSRIMKAPLAIPSNGIRDANPTFGFNLPPREGILLRDRLISGEKITAHVQVESASLKYDLQVPTCFIQGTNPAAGEIIFSAHIFEGYIKQGANDNVSGGAALLEIAHLLKSLYDENRLPRPERNIRFIWVPEFSGTIPWVNKHQDIIDKALCNINLDMVGLNLKESNSFMCLIRTGFSNPHYINDVVENLYTYVGESNREIVSNRGDSPVTKRIVAPSGTDDPFYYQIDQHYGASDHEVFNDWSVRVPGVMLITWPDFYYHTSEDLPNKLDPTQLKRTVVISAAAAHTIASAGDQMAVKIAGEVFTNASKRMGHQLARALDEMADASKEQFPATYRKVRSYADASFINEKATLMTISELAPSNQKIKNNLEILLKNLETVYRTNLAIIDQNAGLKAEISGITPVKILPTEQEAKAMKIIPKPTIKIKESGFGASRSVRNLPDEIRNKYPYQNIASTDELSKLINGTNSILDIKKMLDTQYKRESGLQDIINYVELLKEAGLVEN